MFLWKCSLRCNCVCQFIIEFFYISVTTREMTNFDEKNVFWEIIKWSIIQILLKIVGHLSYQQPTWIHRTQIYIIQIISIEKNVSISDSRAGIVFRWSTNRKTKTMPREMENERGRQKYFFSTFHILFNIEMVTIATKRNGFCFAKVNIVNIKDSASNQNKSKAQQFS